MKALKTLGLIAQIGLDIVSSILIGLLIGMGLDTLFHIESKVFTIVFLVLGTIAGFRLVYYRIKKSGVMSPDDKDKFFTKDRRDGQ
ncbi:MAG: AtpZ/AtpI family protein [Tissierellia bacterium]|nr:AtpZ/AtpI family protein [Tissierellia bacterium]